MADPGEGPGGPGPPVFLDQTDARRAEENFFFKPPPPSPPPLLCHGLDDRALALSEGLDPPLKSWEVGLKYELVGEFELQGFYCSIAWAH